MVRVRVRVRIRVRVRVKVRRPNPNPNPNPHLDEAAVFEGHAIVRELLPAARHTHGTLDVAAELTWLG